MSAQPRLVYIAYGSAQIRMQALYAAFSALAWSERENVELHLFTDDSDPFALLSGRLKLHELDSARLRHLRGPGDYAFRVKIAVLQEMGIAVRSPLAFIDADTFFIGPVKDLFARVSPGNIVLHRLEYHVCEHTTSQVRRFRRRMTGLSGGMLTVDGAMWNSGVIVVDPAQFGVLDQIIDVIDKVSPKYKKALVEQYSVSYFAGRAARVHACDDLVFHYWFQKPEYEAQIAGNLQRWRDLPIEAAFRELRDSPISLPIPARKVKWWENWHSRLRLGRPLADTRGMPPKVSIAGRPESR